MKTVTVGAEKRLELGKGATNKLRRQGYVPGVIYGGEPASLPVAIEESALRRMPLGTGQVFKINVAGDKERSVLVRELQKDPVSHKITHLDLLEVSMTERLTTISAIVITGEAKGVSEGGLLQYGIREVEIECLPADIPEGITVDVSGLEIGESIRVQDLQVPPEIAVLTDPDQVVVSIVAPQMAEVEEEEQEEQAEQPSPAGEAAPEE
ncbi:MAG: 50S ribosomal protein L25 [Clostridia bacterium]|jgi:large subunit ribosomal protein L25|nr:50S ribosomal protein L25 [Clostridia bacterium]